MNGREAAFYILLNFEKTKDRLENLIGDQFEKVSLNPKERKFTYNLCSGVVRNLSLFDWKISALYKGNYKKALIKFKVILRLALYELDFLDYIPEFATVNEYVNLSKMKLSKREAAVVNGILRTYLREKSKYNPEKKFKFADTQISVKYSFPEWLVKRWFNIFGEDTTRELCKAFNKRPEFDIRINLQKTSVDEFEKILEKNDIKFRKSQLFDEVFKITDMQKLIRLKLLEKGYCSVQDESALLVKELMQLKDGEIVLDACAAPGGKFTAILETGIKLKGLYGMEINHDRILKLKENCKRLEFDTYNLISGDAINPPFGILFDKILIDAPCSGFGTIQKNPDIKWRRTLDELKEFSNLQYQILESLSEIVKPGGIIVYSTCTIDPIENENVIAKFLDKYKNNFNIFPPYKSFASFTDKNNYVHILPHKHDMDGSFVVILKKN